MFVCFVFCLFVCLFVFFWFLFCSFGVCLFVCLVFLLCFLFFVFVFEMLIEFIMVIGIFKNNQRAGNRNVTCHIPNPVANLGLYIPFRLLLW